MDQQTESSRGEIDPGLELWRSCKRKHRRTPWSVPRTRRRLFPAAGRSRPVLPWLFSSTSCATLDDQFTDSRNKLDDWRVFVEHWIGATIYIEETMERDRSFQTHHDYVYQILWYYVLSSYYLQHQSQSLKIYLFIYSYLTYLFEISIDCMQRMLVENIYFKIIKSMTT